MLGIGPANWKTRMAAKMARVRKTRAMRDTVCGFGLNFMAGMFRIETRGCAMVRVNLKVSEHRKVYSTEGRECTQLVVIYTNMSCSQSEPGLCISEACLLMSQAEAGSRLAAARANDGNKWVLTAGQDEIAGNPIHFLQTGALSDGQVLPVGAFKWAIAE